PDGVSRRQRDRRDDRRRHLPGAARAHLSGGDGLVAAHLRHQPVPVRDRPPGDQPGAGDLGRCRGLHRPAAAGLGVDRDRDLLRHDRGGRGDGAAGLPRDRQRPRRPARRRLARGQRRRLEAARPQAGRRAGGEERGRARMNHALILPILLPAVVGAVLVIAARYDRVLARVLSLASMVLMLAIALGLFVLASDGNVRTYAVGAWPARFGIVLALDRLAALMLLLGAVLGLGVLLYASNGWDQRGKHFHPLYQFQLMGINGAFLTGDFFNLFVFFEILLIAPYGLMVHGGGGLRVKAGVQYVVTNLVGSSVFLIAVGMIYSVTGTLN